jgi:hypothetical protein
VGDDSGSALTQAAVHPRFAAWLAALEARQLADLTFSEVSRALRALSSAYVERRAKLSEGAALSGAGKRAAFALFYGPLHFLLVQHIVSALGEPFTSIDTLLDMGCGTGASGAAWALACGRPPRLTGVDRHPWAIDEARRTFGDLGINATLRVDDLTRVAFDGRRVTGPHPKTAHRRESPPLGRAGVLLAFAANEIADAAARDAVRERLVAHAVAGGHAIVVEPLAGFVAPWWGDWQRALAGVGGRAEQWRFRTPLPPIVEKLDRAAGLRHHEITGRTITF